MLSQEGAPHQRAVNFLHVGVIVSDPIGRRHQSRANVSLDDSSLSRARRADGPDGAREGIRQLACILASTPHTNVSRCAITVDGGQLPGSVAPSPRPFPRKRGEGVQSKGPLPDICGERGGARVSGRVRAPKKTPLPQPLTSLPCDASGG